MLARTDYIVHHRCVDCVVHAGDNRIVANALHSCSPVFSSLKAYCLLVEVLCC